MSGPSFEKFNYALRPAKNVERKMFVDAFARLARVAPLHTYRYVGFGAVAFHDFSLFHQRLGITDMISIEAQEYAKKRITFNKPYSCIRMHWGLSHDILPQLSWSRRAIVWLDYEGVLDERVLGDIQFLSSTLPSGSVLLVTLRAEPLELGDEAQVHRARLDDLIKRVGVGRVPHGVSGIDLAQWGSAQVSRDIAHDEILSVLADRNPILSASEKIKYRQLFHFQYADGAKMVTFGGTFLNTTDATCLKGSFDDLAFVRTGREPYRIHTPVLTLRELRFLDSRLPVRPGMRPPTWLPSKEGKRYSKVYRYFPVYAELES